jgi:hypothetical protein
MINRDGGCPYVLVEKPPVRGVRLLLSGPRFLRQSEQRHAPSVAGSAADHRSPQLSPCCGYLLRGLYLCPVHQVRLLRRLNTLRFVTCKAKKGELGRGP